MVCADCLENGNSYSREDYLGRGFDPAASEYQQLPMTQHYPHPTPTRISTHTPTTRGSKRPSATGPPTGSGGTRRRLRFRETTERHNTTTAIEKVRG